MNAPDPTVEVTLAEVIAFVREETGFTGELSEGSSLQGTIGTYGDDLSNLLLRFAARYGVNIDGYRWYFHTGEEGFNPIWFVIRPPNRRVQEIPITLAVLLESACRKVWAVEYPPHTLPKVRWDVVLTWVMVGLLAAASVVCCGLTSRS